MFSKKNFLQCISYGSLLAATSLAPIEGQAQENQQVLKAEQKEEQMAQVPIKEEAQETSTQNAFLEALKENDNALTDKKESYDRFIRAKQKYDSVMAASINPDKPSLSNNNVRQDLSIKDRVRQMTPEQIEKYRTFLQKRLEVAEQRLPNKIEKGTQEVTNAIDSGSSFLGKVVSTPLGWVQKGLHFTGGVLKEQLNTISEKTGDTVVSPLIGTVANGALSLTGDIVGGAGRLTDTAVQTTSKTLTNTLRAAATMTRSPKEAGLQLAADTADMTSHAIGDTLTEAAHLTQSAVDTTTAIGKQTIDSTLSPIEKSATYIASTVTPENSADIQLWGAVGRATASNYPMYPLEKIGAKVAKSLLGTGQGINLVSEAVDPLARGNAAYMSPQIIPETVDATISYLDKIDTFSNAADIVSSFTDPNAAYSAQDIPVDTSIPFLNKTQIIPKAVDATVSYLNKKKKTPEMPNDDLKTKAVMTAAYPYIDHLNEQKNANYQEAYLTQMRSIFLEHGAKAEEKRIMNVVADYTMAKENLKEFEQAVQEVQKEKEDKNISISKAIQNKGR